MVWNMKVTDSKYSHFSVTVHIRLVWAYIHYLIDEGHVWDKIRPSWLLLKWLSRFSINLHGVKEAYAWALRLMMYSLD